MPLLFFHIRRHDAFQPDDEGITFDTLEDARSDATSSLREMVADELRSGLPADLTSIEIANNQGDVLAIVAIEDAVLNSLDEDVLKAQ